ncbi:GntR family transcriptional regulator [Lachnotalea sp. AF33-28]|jgi:GntR family transcriptional regulator|uniref:GntR family transcriptional regulator n=1 Tax=Lachnotalea sp. AF33-28 TaxID=2292046 RepID=UPI001FAAADAD|nr:GntR family transcriptional regulator [Lachnotalea sp. AF33-28]
MILDFGGLRLVDGVPIYLQIIRYVKANIISGRTVNGDEMPSRRVLSALLGVNPNTIQKACRQLEEEGLIVSYAGAKSLISVDERKKQEILKEMGEEEARNFIRLMKAMGLSLEDAVKLLNGLWENTD